MSSQLNSTLKNTQSKITLNFKVGNVQSIFNVEADVVRNLKIAQVSRSVS